MNYHPSDFGLWHNNATACDFSYFFAQVSGLYQATGAGERQVISELQFSDLPPAKQSSQICSMGLSSVGCKKMVIAVENGFSLRDRSETLYGQQKEGGAL